MRWEDHLGYLGGLNIIKGSLQATERSRRVRVTAMYCEYTLTSWLLRTLRGKGAGAGGGGGMENACTSGKGKDTDSPHGLLYQKCSSASALILAQRPISDYDLQNFKIIHAC